MGHHDINIENPIGAVHEDQLLVNKRWIDGR